MPDFEIRHAEAADRAELLDMVNSVFAGAQKRPFDFARSHPYLFHDARVPDHRIAVDGGRIIGCVGAYPFDVRVGGETFRTAGIGQVATLPEARGRGVMTSIMEMVCRELDGGDYDFAWLGGDRRRYGRFGWATGGCTVQFEFFDRYLPGAPDEAGVRQLDWGRDFGLLRDHAAALPHVVALNDAELRMAIDGHRLEGWALGGSFIVHRQGGNAVLFGDGQEKELALLLAHLLRLERLKEGDHWKVAVHTADAPSALMETCLRHYWRVQSGPIWMFRVCCLRPLLEKACRAAAVRVKCGSGELGLVNAQTGEAATLLCRRGRLGVADGAGGGAYRLSTTELSEVCFGVCPLDVLLPGLPADSPFRRVLPLRPHIAHAFAV